MMMFLGMADPPGPHSGGVPAVGVAGHLFLFGVLGLLVSGGALMISWSGKLTVALFTVLSVTVALATESYQTTLSARSGNLEDVLVDLMGAAGGGLVAWFMWPWLLSWSTRRP